MQTLYRNYSYESGRRLAVARPRPRLKSYAIIILPVMCLIIAATASQKIFQSGNGGSQGSVNGLAAPVGNQQPAAQPDPPKRQVDIAPLKESLAQTINKYPYDTSVSILDLNSNTLIQVGDSYPFIAASTTKLLTALLYLSDVEAGKASLDTAMAGKPARQQLQLAINQSDNDALLKLNNHLGKDRLAVYAQSRGLKSYDVQRNTITSDDMAQLMAYLYNRQLLNEEHTKLLLSWMKNTSEERFIPPSVPQSMNVYHKAGYLPDRVHDAGIIDNGSTPFVIVIYSKSYTPSYDYLLGQKLYKEVTSQVISTYK